MSNLNKNGDSKASSYICTNLELIIGSLQHRLELIVLTQVTLLVEVQLLSAITSNGATPQRRHSNAKILKVKVAGEQCI